MTCARNNITLRHYRNRRVGCYDPVALAHQKTKAKHLSKAPLQSKGLIPSPPTPPSLSAPRFPDLRGFCADFRPQARGFSAPHATRILKRDNAKFDTKFQTRIFWGVPTYNFQCFWPNKLHTQTLSPNFMLFHRHFLTHSTRQVWRRDGAERRTNLGPSKALLKPRQLTPR